MTKRWDIPAGTRDFLRRKPIKYTSQHVAFMAVSLAQDTHYTYRLAYTLAWTVSGLGGGMANTNHLYGVPIIGFNDYFFTCIVLHLSS